MRTSINQRELRNDSGAILRRVESGETFTVTRNGTPVADLLPHRADATRPPEFVPVATIAASLAQVPDWGAAAFAAELRELDRSIDDDDVDPWSRR